MLAKEHRLGVSEANLVIRHLRLVNPEPKNIEAVVNDIDQIYGVDGVSFDSESSVLNVAYDASRTCIDCIEGALNKNEVSRARDWWTNLKTNYYHYVDDNIKDNAKHEAWCCHNLPPRK